MDLCGQATSNALSSCIIDKPDNFKRGMMNNIMIDRFTIAILLSIVAEMLIPLNTVSLCV